MTTAPSNSVIKMIAKNCITGSKFEHTTKMVMKLLLQYLTSTVMQQECSLRKVKAKKRGISCLWLFFLLDFFFLYDLQYLHEVHFLLCNWLVQAAKNVAEYSPIDNNPHCGVIRPRCRNPIILYLSVNTEQEFEELTKCPTL